MAQEEEFEYVSSPGTPRSPASGEKKKGIKKLISLTKKTLPNFDKSPTLSQSGRFDVGSQSRRRGLTSLFRRSKTQTMDGDDDGDGDGSATPTRELQTDQGFMKETKTEETKSGKKEKTQNFVDKTLKFIGKEKNEASKDDSKPSKISPPAEEAVKEPKLPEKAKEDDQNHHHKHTEATTDAKGKSKEHQELEPVANIAVHEKSQDPASTLPPPLEEKKAIEHDQKHHHVHTKDHKGEVEDKKVVDEIDETVQEKSRDLGSTPPPSPALQEKKEANGCESLAHGLQKICLPWTVNKEDH